MNTNELIAAIKYLKPNAEFSLNEGDYATIEWDVLEGDAPTLSELEAANLQVKAAQEAKAAEAEAKRQALLEKLGITEEEARLLLA